MGAPVIEQPDLEAWVWANIRELSRLGDLTSFAYSATQLGAPGWIWAHFIQIDARHKRKEAARALAETVRQTISGLPTCPGRRARSVTCRRSRDRSGSPTTTASRDTRRGTRSVSIPAEAQQTLLLRPRRKEPA